MSLEPDNHPENKPEPTDPNTWSSADFKHTFASVRDGFIRFAKKCFSSPVPQDPSDTRIDLVANLLGRCIAKDELTTKTLLAGIAGDSRGEGLAALFRTRSLVSDGAAIATAALLHGVPQYGSATTVAGPVDKLCGEGGLAFVFENQHTRRAEVALFLSDTAYSFALASFEHEASELQSKREADSKAHLLSPEIRSAITALLVREVCACNRKQLDDTQLDQLFSDSKMPMPPEFVYTSVTDIRPPDSHDQVEIEVAGHLLQPDPDSPLVWRPYAQVRQRHFVKLVHDGDKKVLTTSTRPFKQTVENAA